MKEQTRTQLLKLAAEMVRQNGMPSEDLGDYQFPIRTSSKFKRNILETAVMANRQAHQWGVRLIAALNAERRKESS